MTTRTAVLKILADGEFHSGTDLGQVIGVSRAAIHKAVKALQGSDIQIQSVTGRGYRLFGPCDMLDQRQILERLSVSIPQQSLHILHEVDSTNQFLLRKSREQDISGHVCMAECQRQGRGRRGRQWWATPYNNIMLSMAWHFATGTNAMAGLSLAAGVAISDALEAYGVDGVSLKWPNDLIWQQPGGDESIRKLGGVLVDVQGEADGPALAVLGIGLNVRLHKATAQHIEQPWIDLHTMTNETIDRNRLSSLIIDHLHSMLQRFESDGFFAFRKEWERRHFYTGKSVLLQQAQQTVQGKVLGIDQFGGLRIEQVSGQQTTYHAGEISLRRAP
ncbi:MAG: bifunctional biotin--[acetyl-CoA-carboxylase] ligase/biotin operon repressor BirA [Gammaproteobacteria bacterium]|nr:MAG: bifunctional biotin--[acetyl-CoA-carboxylase] ligase/biotin operon repressor BirA [Gammaproteobacteria bacterium]